MQFLSHLISRRRFLQIASATSVLNVGPRAWGDPLGIPPGIQLYTVSDALIADQRATLQKIAVMGYKFVEAYPKGMKTSAQEFRRDLDGAVLKCPSIHLPFNDEDMARHFDDAHVLGAEYVVSSTLLPQNFKRPKLAPGVSLMETLTLDDFRRIAEKANSIASLSKEAGFQYCYHNHYFEFRDQGNGQTGYDILLKNTDPDLVKFEIDCGWMILAGHDPIRYMNAFPNRFRMLHIKDFVKGPTYTGGPGRPNGTELGRGRIDYHPIFAKARKVGIRYYFVEQEPPFVEGLTSMQAAAVDCQYLHAL